MYDLFIVTSVHTLKIDQPSIGGHFNCDNFLLKQTDFLNYFLLYYPGHCVWCFTSIAHFYSFYTKGKHVVQ